MLPQETQVLQFSRYFNKNQLRNVRLILIKSLIVYSEPLSQPFALFIRQTNICFTAS
jgi:hypothetical protein